MVADDADDDRLTVADDDRLTHIPDGTRCWVGVCRLGPAATRAAGRLVDLTRVKGMHDEVAVHELMWRTELGAII